MNNNQMIEYKESIFTKIKHFFKRIFSKKENNKSEDIVVQSSTEIQDINETKEIIKEEYETNKKEFLELYEKSKKGEIDLLSLSAETLQKMCALIEEEIKIKERNNDTKRRKIEEYKQKIWQS